MTKALEGIRILEPAVLLAAPYASALMAEFGAEVIKVEMPGSGDPMRALGPFDHGQSLWWKSMARNKKSMTLDLRESEGQQIFRELVATADVVVENFRPGTMDRWNIGWESFHAQYPKLIWVSQTGFGQYGPYAYRPAYGMMFEAYGGLTDAVSFDDTPPSPTGLCDNIAGLTIVYAIMFALYHRDVHGANGQYIDNAAAESVLRIVADNRSAAIDRGIALPPKRKASNPFNTVGGFKVGGVFQCADGKWVSLHPGTAGTKIWHNLMQLIERPDFLDEESYPAGSEAAVERRQEIIDTLHGWFASKPRSEVVALADENAITIGPIYDVADAMNDPHFLARDAFVKVEDDELGTLNLAAPSPRFSETPAVMRTAGPQLGHDTDDILLSMGKTPDEIRDLRERKIV